MIDIEFVEFKTDEVSDTLAASKRLVNTLKDLLN